MILAVDVGNTHIVLGCIEKGEIGHLARMTTDWKKTEHEYAVAMREILAFGGVDTGGFEGAILSSVVGPVTGTMRRAIRLLTGCDSLIVGRGIRTGLDIRLDDPGQIGSDLVLGAVAALDQFRPPVILIDMGTATTISVLDEGGRFLGGAIVPGLGISMDALSSGTSLLPRVSLDPPGKCIGTNTVACMQSGAIFGTASMLDGMIQRIEEELGQEAVVLATGGLAPRVIPFCRRKIEYDGDLLLRGLWILWEKNRRGRK